ncbi:aldo/keto reductase [Streptomyces sp. CB00316]|uniref:aldo/keto reductase n=1 Tax=Streptomyces sp. CB00316 TaxID=1703932 RepID=UPI0009A13380
MHGADPRLVLGLHRSRHHRDILTAALDLGVTALDTAAAYLGFRSHAVLAETATDLLPKFALSTKVGFFPGAGGAEHSLDPSRLRLAIEKAAQELGREPDTVLLHNPERSLTGLSPADGHALLGSACTALVDAAREGLCRTWGVSSWDTRPLGMVGVDDLPSPDVLMVRAGFLVGIDLHASGRPGSSSTRAPLATDGDASSSSSSARHITGSPGSRHATPWYHSGIATPCSTAAASVPFQPCGPIRSNPRRSIRTHVPRSVRPPKERRLRTKTSRTNRTCRASSTRSSTSSTGCRRRSTWAATGRDPFITTSSANG